jgi:anti-anti-sigma factor
MVGSKDRKGRFVATEQAVVASAGAFGITTEARPRSAAIRLRGELDLGCVQKLRAELDRVLKTGISSLLLDLRALTFIDPHGLGLLFELDRRRRRKGLELVILRGGSQPERVLELTGLASVLPLADPSDSELPSRD